jgi:tetratricopeptide (TPR) repeat protein
MLSGRFAVGVVIFAATSAFASPALYLPGLADLDAGWSRHFLRTAIIHFNHGEYIYSLEELDNALLHAPNPGTAAFAHIYKGRDFYALKNYERAQAEFETAFRTAPESGLPYAAAGAAAFQTGRFADALQYFQRGIKAAPHHDLLLNNFAWFRATCPDAAYRNGADAVRMAREACDRAHSKDSVFMDTLAAAQAEAGDFAGAIATEQRGLNDKDAERLERSDSEARLRLYQRHQPYRARSGR